eukprot:scaffold114_cov361-Pinguiococcus_pyrenoidosus.AAC.19
MPTTSPRCACAFSAQTNVRAERFNHCVARAGVQRAGRAFPEAVVERLVGLRCISDLRKRLDHRSQSSRINAQTISRDQGEDFGHSFRVGAIRDARRDVGKIAFPKVKPVLHPLCDRVRCLDVVLARDISLDQGFPGHQVGLQAAGDHAVMRFADCRRIPFAAHDTQQSNANLWIGRDALGKHRLCSGLGSTRPGRERKDAQEVEIGNSTDVFTGTSP